MGIDKTEELLRKFDYKFQRKNDQLIIEMDFSHRVIADFSNSGKITIRDKFIGWSFLSGLLEISLKKAILLNFIILLISTVIYLFLGKKYEDFNFLFVLLASTGWLLLWSGYHLVKFENIKRTLISWNH